MLGNLLAPSIAGARIVQPEAGDPLRVSTNGNPDGLPGHTR
jgi:hypothetical protein